LILFSGFLGYVSFPVAALVARYWYSHEVDEDHEQKN